MNDDRKVMDNIYRVILTLIIALSITLVVVQIYKAGQNNLIQVVVQGPYSSAPGGAK